MPRKRDSARRRSKGIRPSDDDLVEFNEVDPAPPRREGGYTVIGDGPGPDTAAPAAPTPAPADDVWNMGDDIIEPAASPAAAAAAREGAAPPTAPPPASKPTPGNGRNGAVTQDQIESRIQHVIDGLQGLEHLSELVSLRYNPFLEVQEEDVFDGQRNDPATVVQGHFGQGQVQAKDFPSFMEVAKVPRRSEAVELDESIDLTDLPVDELHNALGVHPPAPQFDEMEPEDEEPEDEEPEGTSQIPDPVDTPRGHARKTLLVLAWFRRLQQEGPPPCIYLFIDHCYQLGWIDEDMHTWLEAIAEGVVPRDEDLSFHDLGLSPVELTNIHEANLLFLDDLFTDRLRLGERRYLSRHINEYFGAA